MTLYCFELAENTLDAVQGGLIIVVGQMESATVECPELHSRVVRMAMTLEGNRTAPSPASVMLSVLS
jgi:hypothetical protein